ncbi:LAFA_0G07382g1_1 [Lachancea sp. 'fantastica']|nr:LAFA_0G07382g1_1 [Lachancea sp. 'fantastica']
MAAKLVTVFQRSCNDNERSEDEFSSFTRCSFFNITMALFRRPWNLLWKRKKKCRAMEKSGDFRSPDDNAKESSHIWASGQQNRRQDLRILQYIQSLNFLGFFLVTESVTVVGTGLWVGWSVIRAWGVEYLSIQPGQMWSPSFSLGKGSIRDQCMLTVEKRQWRLYAKRNNTDNNTTQHNTTQHNFTMYVLWKQTKKLQRIERKQSRWMLWSTSIS